MVAPLFFLVFWDQDNFTFGLWKYLYCLLLCMSISLFVINIKYPIGCIHDEHVYTEIYKYISLIWNNFFF